MEAALASYSQALDLYRAVGARLGEANILQAIGDVQRTSAAYDQAAEQYQSALNLYQQIGDRQGEANCYHALGRLALAQEEFADAVRWTEQAIALHIANQSRYNMALDRVTLGRALTAQGNHEEAAHVLRQAAAGYAEIGLIDQAASALTSAADALEKAGRMEERLAVNAEVVNMQPAVAMRRRNYAQALTQSGRLDEAEAQLDAAEQSEPDSPYLALRRAELAQARSDRAGAARWSAEALRRQPDWDKARAIAEWAAGAHEP